MVTAGTEPRGAPRSPIGMSPTLARPIRQDGLETLGTSTQTLIEDAVASKRWELAAELTAVEGRAPYARTTPMATLTALATVPPDPPMRAGPIGPSW